MIVALYLWCLWAMRNDPVPLPGGGTVIGSRPSLPSASLMRSLSGAYWSSTRKVPLVLMRSVSKAEKLRTALVQGLLNVRL